MRLMPKDESFFELLEQLAGHIVTSTEQLEQITRTYPDVASAIEQIEKEEHTADELTQAELKRLDSAFITPIDREDILHLMTELHAVVETIADLAQRFKRYKLKQLDAEFTAQIQAIRQVAAALREVILHLRKGHQLSELNDKLQEMHRLKKQADRTLHDYLTQLFADNSDPLEVIKRKELHDLLERIIDECEDVSNTLQRIILKND